MVWKVARDGGAPTTLATTATVALDVRVSGGQLYWTSALLVPSTTSTGAVSRVPVDGSAAAETLVSQLDSPWDLALDDAYVYWVELPLHAPGRVMKMRR